MILTRNGTLGQARKKFACVHAHGEHDFQVDTETYRREEWAVQICAFRDKHPPPRAFAEVKRKNDGL